MAPLISVGAQHCPPIVCCENTLHLFCESHFREDGEKSGLACIWGNGLLNIKFLVELFQKYMTWQLQV